MRSRRTFQILLLLYFSRRIFKQHKKRKHRFWIRDMFWKRPQLGEMKLFHEMPRNNRVLFYGIDFEIFQSDINTTQYNFSQHLSVGHQTTSTCLHTPSRTILRHCSQLSSCGERKNRTRFYLLAERFVTLRCIAEFFRKSLCCIMLRCSTVCYDVLRCGIFT